MRKTMGKTNTITERGMLYPYKPPACLWHDDSLLVTPIQAPLPQPSMLPLQLLSYPPCEQPNNNVTKHTEKGKNDGSLDAWSKNRKHTASTNRKHTYCMYFYT